MSEMSQIFKNDGKPIKFYLVEGSTYVTEDGVLEPGRVEDLACHIRECGGEICDVMDDAAVWIVGDEVLETYKDYCNNDPDHRAEGADFIRTCIQDGMFAEGIEQNIEKKPMRGRYPGGRLRYTAAEEEMLCQWQAMKTPDARSGGRKGVKIYEMLVHEGQKFPKGRWKLAQNHPMSSWKEHYKKKEVRLNARIAEIVAEKGYMASSRATYQSDRRLNKRGNSGKDDMKVNNNGGSASSAQLESEARAEVESEDETYPGKHRRISGG